MTPLEILVTLWPTCNHFRDFATDDRLAGIRLNSAMVTGGELQLELDTLTEAKPTVPVYFDIKGRQLRVEEVHYNTQYLDITLNHPICVRTPVPVLFKGATDHAELDRVIEDGRRLIFRGGPAYQVRVGESLHIRDKSLVVSGQQFTPKELTKIERVRKFGFKKYFLSYVQCQRDVDEFLELVGRDAEVWLKIEDLKGLTYVAKEFRKRPNLTLVAARGDLFVEVDMPHDILAGLKLIAEKDPEACAGSRMLLSIMQEPVPSCADLVELAWLADLGFKRFMLCDELCLRYETLDVGVAVLDEFRKSYTPRTMQKKGLLRKLFG